MIIYGWNTVNFKTSEPKDLRCHSCNAYGQVTINKYVKYWHLYWIPMFPYGIINELECHSCGSVLQYGSMSEELQRHYLEHKSAKPPFWSFAGLALIAGLIIYGVISSIPDTEGMISKIQNPKVDRIFDYNTEDGEYSSFKITEFDDEYIYFVYNQYQSSSQSDMDQVSSISDFSTDTMMAERKDLIELVNDGTLIDAHW